jgi:Ca2+-transporting ATPase
MDKVQHPSAPTAAPVVDNWHTQSSQQIAQALTVDSTAGLTEAEVQARLQHYGANELEEKGGRTPLDILREQLLNPLVLLLIGAALISGILGKWDSFIAISAIVILNAILGVVQEYRAEQAMAALKKMAAPLVRVKRGGSVQDVPAINLVPGDIVLLEAGSIVPADGRLLEAANLRVAEAALTGESQPVEKDLAVINDLNAPLGDRHNMVYMGTSVTYGRGSAIVTGTGMKTQLGRIAELIQTVDAEKTPLQRRLDELGKVLFGAALVVTGIAFVIGLIAGVPLIPPADDPRAESVLLNAVAIAVAVVPEGLPAVVTIALALGARRMLRRNALIRKLAAVETLGSVTVICSDKTGTLTENKMTVTLIDVAGRTASLKDVITEHESKQIIPVIHNAQLITLFGSALCSDVILQQTDNGKQQSLGDPTEVALVLAAGGLHMVKNHLDDAFPRRGEVPFDSDRKRMTTIHNPAEDIDLTDEERHAMTLLDVPKDSYVAFSKGAVDSLLTVCQHVWVEDKVIPLTAEWRQRVETDNSQLAKDGLRVLGLAYRILPELPAKPTVENIEHDLVFVGMVGIIDPPRGEVPAAVATAKTAGIRPIMITGDHPMTALAIAKQIGMAQDGDKVMTGHELSRMDEAQLRETVKTVSVYARVSPENKLQIVQALQANGEVTAMTGDGVNDAPALKRSNIGVAMGITGTAVSKEASDTVLLDDNFATIVSAVEEGRTIYDNVRRFIKYLLASNTGELFVLLSSQLVAGMGLPLTTLQILWMNLITDGIPALALGVENPERGAMKRKPYLPNESLFGRGLGRHIVLVGLLMGISGLLLGLWAFGNYNAEGAQIMGITVDQFIAAENSTVHITETAKVAAEAARIGITPEQLVQIHNGVPTTDYHQNTWNTMVFMFLTLAQMGHALGLRSHTDSLFTMKFFSNRLLLGAVVVTIILQLIAIYTPFFNNIFNTTALSPQQLLICVALSSIVFIGVEVEKLLIRRKILN